MMTLILSTYFQFGTSNSNLRVKDCVEDGYNLGSRFTIKKGGEGMPLRKSVKAGKSSGVLFHR